MTDHTTGSRPEDGQEVIRVDNGRIRLGIAPPLGGRLLSLALGEAEFLWRNRAVLDHDLRYVGRQPLTAARTLGDWVNLGGDKTWPAPQGWDGPDQWAGPPDPVLDGGPYAATVVHDDGATTVELTSQPDERSGLQVTRRIHVDADLPTLRMDLQFTNTAATAVTWSIWNVTQLPLERDDNAEDGLFLGVAPGPLDLQEVVVGTGVPHVRRLGARLAHIPPGGHVGKVGLPTATGWLAHVGRAGTLAWTFAVDPDATYPDGGSRVEVWHETPQPTPIAHLEDLQPAQSVVEVEVLGPLVTLAPGASTTLRLDLQVAAARERVERACPAGLVHRELALGRREDGSVALTGRVTTVEGAPLLVTVDGQQVAEATNAGGGSPTNLEVALGALDPGVQVDVEVGGQLPDRHLARLTVPPEGRPASVARVDGLSAYNGRGLLGQVVEHLGRTIVGRTMTAGTTIDLDALEARFGVSRSVLREALRVLTAKGLVEARQRRGTSVRPPSTWSRLDADVLRWRVEVSDLAAVTAELDEVRVAIEPAAAGLAARRRNEDDLRAMDEALAAMADTWTDPERAVAADLAFHRALLMAAHNELLSAMEVVLEAALAARNRAVHASPHVEDPVPLHAAVVEAIRAHDPDRAVAAVNDLLSTARTDAMRLVGNPEESQP